MASETARLGLGGVFAHGHQPHAHFGDTAHACHRVPAMVGWEEATHLPGLSCGHQGWRCSPTKKLPHGA